MKKNQGKPTKAAGLRHRAETRLHAWQRNKRSAAGAPKSQADPQRLLHELQVHQVELEMQNEELSRAKVQAEACAARYSDFYDFAPTGYVSLDDRGRIHELNLTAAKLLGKNRAALAGTLLVSGVARRDRETLLRHLKTASETEAKVTGEVDLRSEGGRVVPVQLCTVYRRGESGQSSHYLAAITDITERRQAERALHEAHGRIVAVLESITDSFFSLDKDFRVTYLNREAEKMLGITRRELMGKNLWRVFPEAVGSRFQREYERAMAENQTVHFEEFYPPFNQWFEVHAYPYESGMSVYFHDITGRKRSEEAIRQLNAELEERVRQRTATIRTLAIELTLAEQREKSRLAQVLHDHLQQLLVGARFHLERASQTPPDEREKALREVDQLLSQCGEAARTLSVELSPPVLHKEGLAAALRWLGDWMREKHGLAVEVTSGPNPAPLPEALSVLLYQTLRELLFNVVKHARVKSVCVTMDWTEAQVSIVVSDQGKGFDPARLQTATPSSGKFGLFAIRERLGLLDGQMEVESAPGRGSRFTLRVPLRTPAAKITKGKTKRVS